MKKYATNLATADGQNTTMMSNKKTKKTEFSKKNIFQKIFFIFIFIFFQQFYFILYYFKILKIVQNGPGRSKYNDDE